MAEKLTNLERKVLILSVFKDENGTRQLNGQGISLESKINYITVKRIIAEMISKGFVVECEGRKTEKIYEITESGLSFVGLFDKK